MLERGRDPWDPLTPDERLLCGHGSTRRCRICEKVRPLDDFYERKKVSPFNRDRYFRECIPCWRDMKRWDRVENREHHNAMARQRMRRKRERDKAKRKYLMRPEDLARTMSAKAERERQKRVKHLAVMGLRRLMPRTRARRFADLAHQRRLDELKGIAANPEETLRRLGLHPPLPDE